MVSTLDTECELTMTLDFLMLDVTSPPGPGTILARLLLNPDLFRDGMLNPDLASPG